MRLEVQSPLHPDLGNMNVVWTDMNEALRLPSWHFSFEGCTAGGSGRSNHEKEVWEHLWSAHRRELIQFVNQYQLQEPFTGFDSMQEETAFALYTEALCECERRSVPKLDIATDCRALNHVGEVIREDNISTLICFISNCKHI